MDRTRSISVRLRPLLGAIGCATLLAATGLAQTPHPRHRKTPTPAEDDQDASPSPSPSASSSPSASPSPSASASPEPSAPPANSATEAAPSAAAGASPSASPAAVSTIDASEIEGFDTQPAPVRALLAAALDLTKRNLTYTYGSSDPAAGGLDCSGTIYYLLRQAGFGTVPRQSSEQYEWVRQQSYFYAVLSRQGDSPELREMRPGDLLFWTGTYQVDRDPPVTHTMIYLGKRKRDGRRLMIGSSDGRTYDGERRNGVSVFDFKLPAARSGDAADAATAAAPDHAPNFAGYGPIPGLAALNDVASRHSSALTETAPPEKEPESAKETPRKKKRAADEDDAEASPSPTPKKSHHTHPSS